MKTATSTPTRLTVETFPHEEGCRAYLLIDSATHQALAIDPRLDQVGAIQDSLRRHGARLTHALDTHTHADHLSGVHELCERTGARMLAHARAKTTRSPERVTPPTAWMQKAWMTLPRSSSGTPTTPASETSGWLTSALSTSAVPSRYPLTLMTSSMRPMIQR